MKALPRLLFCAAVAISLGTGNTALAQTPQASKGPMILVANKPMSSTDQKKVEGLLAQMDPSTYAAVLPSANGSSTRKIGAAKLDMSKVSQQVNPNFGKPGSSVAKTAIVITIFKEGIPNGRPAQDLQKILMKYQ